MANTSSALKKIRVDKRKTEINSKHKHAYKDAVKQARKALATTDTKKVEESLSYAFKRIDKAAKQKVIHSGKADRIKSRLSKALAKKTAK